MAKTSMDFRRATSTDFAGAFTKKNAGKFVNRNSDENERVSLPSYLRLHEKESKFEFKLIDPCSIQNSERENCRLSWNLDCYE